jgi:hypothetical protein
MLFVRAYPRETQEMVFDAHDRAFALFKGTCGRGIYDNMKTAVETVFVGKDRLYNRRFLQMCSHYIEGRPTGRVAPLTGDEQPVHRRLDCGPHGLAHDAECTAASTPGAVADVHPTHAPRPDRRDQATGTSTGRHWMRHLDPVCPSDESGSQLDHADAASDAPTGAIDGPEAALRVSDARDQGRCGIRCAVGDVPQLEGGRSLVDVAFDGHLAHSRPRSRTVHGCPPPVTLAQTRSKAIATEPPPPRHKVANPYRP